MTICILGRQPAIGLAELEALYGSEAVRPVGKNAALVDADINFKRLGGSVKAGTIITTLQGTDPQKAFLWLQKNLSEHVENVDGKLKLGISLYDLKMPVAKLNANALSLKKVLKQNGQSVRIIPNTETALSSAQTYHNNLTDERGCEIMVIRDGNTTLVARATDVQGIDAYRKRDQERPHRDTFVGMLPPKLAQTIVNLAAFTLDEDRKTKASPANQASTSSSDGFAFPAKRGKTDNHLAPSEPEEEDGGSLFGQKTILDPFCGTGVVLQEAALMGYQIYGTDLSEKMVRYTRDNINWLFERYPIKTGVYYETADATDHTWRQPIDIVACEGYLGHPFASEPSKEALMETIQTCNVVMRKFLKNISSQLKPGTPLCIAAPTWFVRGQIYHLPALDDLENLGYNRIDFVHANREDLVYHRTDQVTGRELVVLTKE
jgi:tRNA G10  N-methylase Trm11